MKYVTFELPINTRELVDSLLELEANYVIVKAKVQRNPFSLEETLELELSEPSEVASNSAE